MKIKSNEIRPVGISMKKSMSVGLVLVLSVVASLPGLSTAQVNNQNHRQNRENENHNGGHLRVVDGFELPEGSGIQLIDEPEDKDTPPLSSLSSDLEWPWNKKNKTKPVVPKNETDDSCYGHMNCDDCYGASSMCHWCSHDNRCHVRGSFSGCIMGVGCGTNSSKKEDKSCLSHKTCGECALSSTFCHWCEHDNKCHAVGSWGGCVVGVNCYSNDRCERDEPERIHVLPFQYISTLPLIILFSLGGIALCCATVVCGIAVGMKGAYDDLISTAGNPEDANDYTIMPTSVIPTAPEDTGLIGEDYNDVLDPETEGGVMPLGTKGNETDGVTDSENDANEPLLPTDASEPLLQQTYPSSTVADTQQQMVSSLPMGPGPTTVARRKRSSNYARCLCGFCGLCYLVTVVTIAGAVMAGIYYYPKIPQYSICSDTLAWKSLVESLTSIKVQANIDILASIQNPNHLTVVMDRGSGTFSYKGNLVGTFDIPPTTSEKMTITDVMVKSSFTPDKWDEVALAAAYYKGNLPLDISAEGTFRIPFLYNYTFTAELKHMLLNVADPTLSNRELCACPTWDDLKNKTKTIQD